MDRQRGFQIVSWSLYDLANQFFALNIVSLYFPLWLSKMKVAPIFYSITFGVSVFCVAFFAPLFGTIADIGGRRKPFLIYFTLLSIVFTFGMGLFTNVALVLLFFGVANFGCQAAVVFYNALLVDVAPRERLGLVSGFGRAFGYLGAACALLFAKPVVLRMGYQPTFLLTGLMFLLFALPCMVFVRQEAREKGSLNELLGRKSLKTIFSRLRRTLIESYKFEDLRNFLKAAFFGLCVVHSAILFTSIYIAKVFKVSEAEISNIVLFSAVFALIASLVAGLISDRFGYKRSLVGVFILWGITFLLGGTLRPPFQWLIGALAAISLGSTWVISRALIVRLVPKEKVGEVFGLFNLVAYLSAIVGPFIWGLIVWAFSSYEEFAYRLACLSSIVFVAVGTIFLLRLKDLKPVI